MLLLLNNAGTKSPLPKGAAAFVGSVNVLHVSLTQAFQEVSGTVRFFRRQKKMNMVGHQNKGMDEAVCTFGVLGQPVKIKQIVFLPEKTSLPVVSTLNDVERNTRHNDSGSSWHKEWILRATEKCNNKRGLSPN